MAPEHKSFPVGRDPKRLKKLKGFRATIRSKALQLIDPDVDRIVSLQKYQKPWLDAAAKAISATVTHEFYIAFIPFFYWCGFTHVARNLVVILALGIYTGNVVKDYLCLPRPLSPPVKRGETNHEYGLPSTHSVNSLLLPMALVFSLAEVYPISTSYLVLIFLVGLVYASLVGLSRMYLGVHSMADVVCGYLIALGLLFVWFGLGLSRVYTEWVTHGEYVNSAIFLATLLLLWISPEPVEPCPCFEDSVCFLSCVVGTVMGEQHLIQTGLATLDGGIPFDYVALSPHTILLRKFIGFLISVGNRVIGKYILIRVLPVISHILKHFTRDHVNEYCKDTLPKSFQSKNRHLINQAIYLPTKFLGYIILCWSVTFLSPYMYYKLALV